MNKIYIKTNFSGWKEVDKETATRWAKYLIEHSNGIPDERKYEWMNTKLKGITAEELLKGE